jgi:Fibronectin type III domain
VKKIVLPLAAILIASPVWASSNSSSKLTFSAAALSFNGSSNNVSSQPLTISVTGSQPVTITSVTYSNGNFFSTPVNLPITLPRGQSFTGQISARPQSTPQTGKLTIVSNVGTYTVSLSETAAAQAPASHQVDLTWQAPASSSDPVDSYQVNRAVAGSTTYSTVGTTTAGSTTFADTSVKAGTTYQYEVRSVDDQGETSGPSNLVTLAIP